MSQMGNHQHRYPLDERREMGRSYLLRCWQEQGAGTHAWHFIIQPLGGGQARKGFTSLQDLTAYLEEELERMKTDSHLLT
jgi:hypothetical protein